MKRREFLRNCAGACSMALAADLASADAGQPEVTRIRLVQAPAICLAPQYLAEAFLRMEGFTKVDYVRNSSGSPSRSIDEGKADFTQDAVPALLPSVEAGGSSVALAGIHVGCYELFVHEGMGAVSDLRGKTIAIPSKGSPDHMLMASILAYVGIDPVHGVRWIMGSEGPDAVNLFRDRKADAYLAFAPQGYLLRTEKVGRLIINTTTDRPWSQYFCCMVVGRREFVSRNPVATKRALRAFLRATDLCASDPQRAARMLVDRGFESRYDMALEILQELSYSRWREANPEDSIRFHALRLHEAKIIKSTPERVVRKGTDWRFLDELRRELKA